MDALLALPRRYAAPLLRIAMAVTVLWIGALKLVDPTPVVGLLRASLPVLAHSGVVYLLGAVEIAVAAMLLTGFAVRYAGLILMGLFAGTLAIFLIAPRLTYGDAGFPLLTLVGEFLLKDLVLFAAAVAIVAAAPATEPTREPAADVAARAA